MVDTEEPYLTDKEREIMTTFIVNEWLDVLKLADTETAMELLTEIAHFDSIDDKMLSNIYIHMKEKIKEIKKTSVQ